ncbi:nuclear transport factor 2 family protein [Actinomadura sp. 21ATH]|uniref:nuclear transport factor 2 family protein n=1 Tax=Actinomadura sp. 21ATH TaxID=1735444 RepID=UPI0035C1B924
MITESATRKAVQEFLQTMAAGEDLGPLFAETVDWQLDWPEEGHPDVPWIRSRTTRGEAAAHFRELREYHVPEKDASQVHQILVDGPDAVVLATIAQTVRATGHAYTARCALHLTFENDLITRYHVYEDSLSVANALSRHR